MAVKYFADQREDASIALYPTDIWDKDKIPSTAIEVTYEQWQKIIANPGKFHIEDGELTEVIVPEEELLKQAKERKLIELNAACGESILGRFVSTYKGDQYQFSYDAEAQSNFAKAGRAFDKGFMTSIGWTAYDMAGNVVRLTLEPADFDIIFIDSLVHVNTNIARFRDELQPLVGAATTLEAVQAIVWE